MTKEEFINQKQNDTVKVWDKTFKPAFSWLDASGNKHKVIIQQLAEAYDFLISHYPYKLPGSKDIIFNQIRGAK